MKNFNVLAIVVYKLKSDLPDNTNIETIKELPNYDLPTKRTKTKLEAYEPSEKEKAVKPGMKIEEERLKNKTKDEIDGYKMVLEKDPDEDNANIETIKEIPKYDLSTKRTKTKLEAYEPNEKEKAIKPVTKI